MLRFFQAENDEGTIGAFVCEVCKRPILDIHLAMVVKLRDRSGEAGRPADEVEVQLGIRGIIAHKGECDQELRRQHGHDATGWQELSNAIVEALYNAGMHGIPDNWFDVIYGKVKIKRQAPAWPPTGRETYVDDSGEKWAADAHDDSNQTVRLKRHLSREKEVMTISRDEFQAHFTKLQNM